MKQALVLSGGGVKGCFEIGALKSILAKGETFDRIYGTSIGALNGASISFAGFENTVKSWEKIKTPADLFNVFYPRLLWSDSFRTTDKMWEKIKALEVFNPNPNIEAVSCMVSLKTGEVRYTYSNSSPKLKFLRSVYASGSIPFLMPAVDGEWVDGGVREQTPLAQAVRDGYENIVVILCNPRTVNPLDTWKRSWPYFYSSLNRTTDLMSLEIKNDDMNICELKNRIDGYKNINLRIIAPEFMHMDTMDFFSDKIEEFMKHGEEMGKLL